MIRRLDPVLVLAEWPVTHDREGLYMFRHNDGFVVWTEQNDRWQSILVSEIEPIDREDMSEELIRQRGIFSDA